MTSWEDLDRQHDVAPAPPAAGGAAWEDLDKQHGFNPPQAEAVSQGWGGAILDTAGRVGRTADDFVRAAADTVTFGLLDRALGADEIKKTAEARKRSPYVTIAGDVAGAVATPGAGVIGGAISRGLGGAGTGLAAGLGRAAGYGVEGAVYGAGQAAGHTYDWKDLPENVAIGSVLGGAGGALTGPLARVGLQPRAATPTTQELFDEGGRRLTRYQTAPVEYSASNFSTGPGRFRPTVDGVPIPPSDTPAFHGFMERARALNDYYGRPGQVGPQEVSAMWRDLNRTVTPQGGREGIAAAAFKRELGDFIRNPANVTRGSPAAAREAAETFASGNANYAGAARANTVESTVRDAVRSAESANSGLNVENRVRQKIKDLVKENRTKDPLLGYTPRERESVQNLISRSTLPNYVRGAGNLLGGGGGLGAVVTAGAAGGAGFAATQDPQTAAVLALTGLGAGNALKRLGNRAMLREVDEATAALRQRTPLFTERFAATPGWQAGPGHAYTPTRELVEGARKAITLQMLRNMTPPPVEDEPLRLTVTPR